MPIVDDYAGIAAELRRIQAEPPTGAPAASRRGPVEVGTGSPQRATSAGELLYWRLVNAP